MPQLFLNSHPLPYGLPFPQISLIPMIPLPHSVSWCPRSPFLSNPSKIIAPDLSWPLTMRQGCNCFPPYYPPLFCLSLQLAHSQCPLSSNLNKRGILLGSRGRLTPAICNIPTWGNQVVWIHPAQLCTAVAAPLAQPPTASMICCNE